MLLSGLLSGLPTATALQKRVDDMVMPGTDLRAEYSDEVSASDSELHSRLKSAQRELKKTQKRITVCKSIACDIGLGH